MLTNSYGLLPYIVQHTKVSSHLAAILDQIWYKDSSNVLSSGIILSDMTDNFPVFLDVNSRVKNNIRNVLIFPKANNQAKEQI